MLVVGDDNVGRVVIGVNDVFVDNGVGDDGLDDGVCFVDVCCW